MTQMMMDFRRPQKKRRRSLILTTSRRDFDRARTLDKDHITTIRCVNDIVSTTEGREEGRGTPHFPIRRVTLLKRALYGEHDTIWVRTEMHEKVKVAIACLHEYNEDDCQFLVDIKPL